MRDFLDEILPARLKARPLLKDVVTTSLFAIGGRVLGLLIPFFIAFWFGASGETDVFFLVYTLVYLVSFVLGDTMGEILIPYFSDIRVKGGNAAVQVGRFFVFGGVSSALLVALLYVIARRFLPLLVPFSERQLSLTFAILGEMAPMVVILFWCNILMAFLNAAKRFALPAFSPAIRSTVTILLIYALKGKLGIHSVALAFVVGETVRLVVLFWRTYLVEGFPLARDAFMWDSGIFRVATTAFFQSGAKVLGTINSTVDRVMASWLVVGSVSILYYSDRLEMVATLLLAAGTMNVVVSYWSERFSKEGLDRLLKDVKKTGWAMGLVSLGVALLFALLSKPIVRLVLGHGAMSREVLEPIRLTLVCYLAGFPFKMVNSILVRTYIVLQRTRILLLQASVSVFLNVIFNLVFMKYLGVAGLALSTSSISALSLGFWIWSLWYLRKNSSGEMARG